MSIFHACVLAIGLCCAGNVAFAQSPSGQRPLQQKMSPEEFEAAGLEKLSAVDASLNVWLDRKIDAEVGKATAQVPDADEASLACARAALS
jgi:hypothetical protein